MFWFDVLVIALLQKSIHLIAPSQNFKDNVFHSISLSTSSYL